MLLACLAFLPGEAFTVRATHDDGLVGQCAERVLLGELPRRDLDEPCTGGSSARHAALFAVFGVGAQAPRAVTFIVALVVVLTTWALAARAVGSWC